MHDLESLKAGDYFEDELFEGLDLQGFDFAEKEFFRCVFRNANLQESCWNRARLEDCAFEGCDLTRMVPGDLRAYGVRYQGCKVMGVEWTGSVRDPQFSFEDCNLRYASFLSVNLRATRFLRCRVTEANFIDVDLVEADFAGSDLTGSSFEGANLMRADLSTAQGAFVDPAKNRVKDLRIPVETAVLLAASLGMRVGGFNDAPEPRSTGKSGRRRR